MDIIGWAWWTFYRRYTGRPDKSPLGTLLAISMVMRSARHSRVTSGETERGGSQRCANYVRDEKFCRWEIDVDFDGSFCRSS